MKKVVEVLFMPNGNTAVVHVHDHKQITELQKPWYKMFIKFLEENDVDVVNSTFLFPDSIGSRKAKVIKTDDGYNLDFDFNNK